jgi:hypothetical protein
VNTLRISSFLVCAAFAWLPSLAGAQSVPDPINGRSISPSVEAPHTKLDLTYKPPTEKTKLRNYFFDTFGPYPVAGVLTLAAINQASNAPPDWGQGFKGYGDRVASDFGIALVTTTTRYALAEAFKEDTIYYRCECTGVFRRFGHAVISTVTARVGPYGRRRLSFPSLVAPYAGTMTAVYGWYPSRYGFQDGLRTGNYALLAFVGGNVAREFIYGGPHTLFRHWNHSVSPGPGPAGRSNP